MIGRFDYTERDEFDIPDVHPQEDPLEWALYWNERGSFEDVASFALIDIAHTLRRIAPPPPEGEPMSDDTDALRLLRELQCRLDDLAAQVAHLTERIDQP